MTIILLGVITRLLIHNRGSVYARADDRDTSKVVIVIVVHVQHVLFRCHCDQNRHGGVARHFSLVEKPAWCTVVASPALIVMLLSPRFASCLVHEVQHRGVHVNLETEPGSGGEEWPETSERAASPPFDC
jgi:hypothetical protein